MTRDTDDDELLAADGAAKGRRPTLKTISRITGYGVTTVSRALKDGPELSAETRARVQAVAARIGYRPDRAGVRLRTGRTHVIGLIVDQNVTIADFERQIILGISEALANTSYHLVVTPLLRHRDLMGPVRYMVENAAADGLIFTHTQPRDERVRYLADLDFPFVTHGRTDMGVVHPFYDFDNTRFLELAVQRLAKRGRRRLALIGPARTLTCSTHMLDGFNRALSGAGIEGWSVEGVDLDSDPKLFHRVGQTMMAGPRVPDGIVCANEARCLALIAGLRDAGAVIGEDIDVIAKDTTSLLDYVSPAIDSYFEDLAFAGAELARLILARLAGTPVEQLQTITPPVLHART